MKNHQSQNNRMICHFNKLAWKRGMDYDDSHCFRTSLGGRNIISFNKKFTKIIEHDDHIEVHIDDWYITPKSGKYMEQTMDRQYTIEYLKKIIQL